MLRSKYKYSKNHGLLPPVSGKPYRAPLTSFALLGKNDEKTYQLQMNPLKPNVFMLFNDREYLHRQCTMVSHSEDPNLMSQMLNKAPLKARSLTVYIANDYKACEKNIVGEKEEKDSLLWQLYEKMNETKSESSKIMLSILGVQNQNEITDLLIIDRASDLNDYLPEYLKEASFRKRKILVNKNYKTGRFEPQNCHRQELSSEEDLRDSLLRYQTIKNEMETMKLSDPSWNWFEGQLFILSEVEGNWEDGIFQSLKSHYILRVNQYLRSTSSLMLKLGMNLRKMQEKYSNIVCDNNESKLFRLLKQCFQKNKETQPYHVYLILEIGHYQSLKDEYQNLVPTSELFSTKMDKTMQLDNASFLYLKHYHDHPKLAEMLSQLLSTEQQSKDIQQYLEEGHTKYLGKKSSSFKSYVQDTISSLKKKKIRNFVISQEEGEEGVNADIEGFIRKTAKLYKQDQIPKNRAESLSGVNRTSFRKSTNNTKQRMSLIEWGSKQRESKASKVYASRRAKVQMSEAQRRSIECYSVDSKRKRWKKYNTNQGFPLKGGEVDVQSFSSKDKTTKQIVDDLVQREMMLMDRDEIYNQDLVYEKRKI